MKENFFFKTSKRFLVLYTVLNLVFLAIGLVMSGMLFRKARPLADSFLRDSSQWIFYFNIILVILSFVSIGYGLFIAFMAYSENSWIEPKHFWIHFVFLTVICAVFCVTFVVTAWERHGYHFYGGLYYLIAPLLVYLISLKQQDSTWNLRPRRYL